MYKSNCINRNSIHITHHSQHKGATVSMMTIINVRLSHSCLRFGVQGSIQFTASMRREIWITIIAGVESRLSCICKHVSLADYLFTGPCSPSKKCCKGTLDLKLLTATSRPTPWGDLQLKLRLLPRPLLKIRSPT